MELGLLPGGEHGESVVWNLVIPVVGLRKNRVACKCSVETRRTYPLLDTLWTLLCIEDILSFSRIAALLLALDRNRILAAGICMVRLSWYDAAKTLGLLLLKTMDRGIDNLNLAFY